MKTETFLSLILGVSLLISGTLGEASGNGQRANSSERILNGDRVDGVIKQVPWAMSLRQEGRHICGATFVSPMMSGGKVVGWSSESTQPVWAITAAHCVTDGLTGEIKKPDDFSVYGGVLNLQTGPGEDKGEVQHVAEILVPDGTNQGPAYNHVTLENDIALLRLKDSTVSLFPHVRSSIRLPNPREVGFVLRPYTAVHTSGWGRTSEGGFLSPDLLEVRLPIVDKVTCQKIYAPFGDKIADSMLCSGYISGEYDSCQGDSGGGLFYRPTHLSDELAKPVMLGIVSWGRGCGRSDLFGIYANVANLQDWVIDKIEGK